jgi:hypothetical protein
LYGSDDSWPEDELSEGWDERAGSDSQWAQSRGSQFAGDKNNFRAKVRTAGTRQGPEFYHPRPPSFAAFTDAGPWAAAPPLPFPHIQTPPGSSFKPRVSTDYGAHVEWGLHGLAQSPQPATSGSNTDSPPNPTCPHPSNQLNHYSYPTTAANTHTSTNHTSWSGHSATAADGSSSSCGSSSGSSSNRSRSSDSSSDSPSGNAGAFFLQQVVSLLLVRPRAHITSRDLLSA